MLPHFSIRVSSNSSACQLRPPIIWPHPMIHCWPPLRETGISLALSQSIVLFPALTILSSWNTFFCLSSQSQSVTASGVFFFPEESAPPTPSFLFSSLPSLNFVDLSLYHKVNGFFVLPSLFSVCLYAVILAGLLVPKFCDFYRLQLSSSKV